MRKFLSIIIILGVFLFSFCACNYSKYRDAEKLIESGKYDEAIVLLEELEKENYSDSSELLKEAKYEKANELLKNQNYNEAIVLFDELSKENYLDSIELLKETKYEIVKSSMNPEDKRCATYLDELIDQGYKDAQKLYDQIYRWKADIAINTTQQSPIHYDDLNISAQMMKIYFFNFRTYGGPPDGEFEGTYEITFSNRKKTRDTFIGHNNDFYLSVVLSGTETPKGLTTFTIYDDNGNILDQKRCNIH